MREKRIFLLGCPLELGGANSEMGHTALLWRLSGFAVTVVPTWKLPENDPWPAKLLAAGCQIVVCSPLDLGNVPGLPGGIVSGWCNQFVIAVWDRLAALGCRMIWSPSMTYWWPAERRALAAHPPAAIHFQSEYQRAQLAPWLKRAGYPPARQYLIRGALDLGEFPLRTPVRQGRSFTVGRLARADHLKWSRDFWPVLENVRKRRISLSALCMGWNAETEGKCGRAPEWAECFSPGCMPVQQFLGRCDALLCMNGGAHENWPRVGLEAMAAGVPVVADNAGGWPEMIRHGETGILCDGASDFQNALTRLANDEPFRLSLAQNARRSVERLCDPDVLGPQWASLFQSLTTDP